jgi:hypothetical protein
MGRSASRRKILSSSLGWVVLVLLCAFTALNAFNLKFLNPVTTGEIVVFTGLSALVFLIFVAVLLLLARNVLKLYADQRSSVMGTRLRTRMLWGAVLVSLVPIVFMFLFSYGLMNRSVNTWFSQPVTEMREDSNRVAQQLAQYTSANARTEAESIAVSLAVIESISEGARGTHSVPDLVGIDSVLHQHEISLQNGFAIVYSDGRAIASFHMPQRTGKPAHVKPGLTEQSSAEEDSDGEPGPSIHTTGDDRVVDESYDAAILTAARRSDLPIFSQGDTDYALGTAATKQGGIVVVGIPAPFGMLATMAQLQKADDDYWTIHRSQRQVRNLYMLLLLLMTTLALFACSWLALHLSKQVTRPMEALADAMEAIAAGNYAHRVGESATEELGELVRSFNHMAADLEQSRLAVETSNLQLSSANATLEARRSELETMLETIPNGVATLDTESHIVLANRALTEMLDPGGQTPFIARPLHSFFSSEAMETLDRLLQRSHRMGSASGDIEMTVSGADPGSGSTMYLQATVALLETASGIERVHHGYVLVLENATELLRAQKQSAWKEVARRVAHEIKNPLTPISLSAEQIHRHIDRLGATLASAARVALRRCHPTLQRGHIFRCRDNALSGRPVRGVGSVSHRSAATRRSQPYRAEFACPLRRPPAEHPSHPKPCARSSTRPRRPRSHQTCPRQPHRQRCRGHAEQPAARTTRLHLAPTQRHGRTHRLRHRRRPYRRDARTPLPALLLYQTARHRPRPRNRRKNHTGAAGNHPRRKEPPGRRKIHHRATACVYGQRSSTDCNKRCRTGSTIYTIRYRNR